MHDPTDSHWAAVKHILRYLKGTTSYGFHITRGSSFALHGFIDDDWAGMIASLRVAILSFLIRRRFLGNLASNAQLLAPLLRLSIKLLLMVPLKSFGFNTCEQICRFPQSLLLPFGVIILVLPISQPILYSMLVLSMLKWIITLSMTALPRKRFRFVLFPLGINLPMS